MDRRQRDRGAQGRVDPRAGRVGGARPAYVVAGHRIAGAPTDLTAISHTRDYLELFEKTVASSADAAEAEASLLAACPDAGLKIAANLGTKVAKGE